MRSIVGAAVVAVMLAAALVPVPAVGAEQANDIDRAFLDLTALHHRDGIEMARLAEKKATRDDVKAFAPETRSGQEKDLADIVAAREQLFKGQPEADRLKTPQQTMERAKMQAESREMMARLNTAQGAEFDHQFVTSMTKHHRDAVQMGKYVASSAGDDKVRDLAKRMVGEQTRELAQLEKMHGGHDGQASARTRQ